ncbi:Periplasmic Murein Peptide-Binding Protein MppA [Cronobacter sakazakii 696]|nr:Periplasmic Murein Peptide-Binding Protein MppA [Cronobacter sakazakii 696]
MSAQNRGLWFAIYIHPTNNSPTAPGESGSARDHENEDLMKIPVSFTLSALWVASALTGAFA